MKPSNKDRALDTIQDCMLRSYLRGRTAGGRYLSVHGNSDDDAAIGWHPLLPDSKVIAAIMLSARLFRH